MGERHACKFSSVYVRLSLSISMRLSLRLFPWDFNSPLSQKAEPLLLSYYFTSFFFIGHMGTYPEELEPTLEHVRKLAPRKALGGLPALPPFQGSHLNPNNGPAYPFSASGVIIELRQRGSGLVCEAGH